MENKYKNCPYCAEKILKDAVKCRYCNTNLKSKKSFLLIERIYLHLKGYINYVTQKENRNKFLFLPLALCAVIFISVILFSNTLIVNGFQNLFDNGNDYTLNPRGKEIPMNSVVKIVVEDGEEKSFGSGLYFTNEGHILTNAHVVTNFLGSPVDKIKVCYTKNGIKNCSEEATIIDYDLENDLAIIKTNSPLAIRPYLLKIEENQEKRLTNEIPIGEEISVVGFPGVADGSINLTKGIVSGYKYKYAFAQSGIIYKIPSYIRTDTEINHGNSGGAVFDKENRYIGIPTYINQDEGGKIGYITYWPIINRYLNKVVYKGLIDVKTQYVADKKVNDTLRALRSLIAKEQYAQAKDSIKTYIEKNPKDTEGLIRQLSLLNIDDQYLNTISLLETFQKKELETTILLFKAIYYHLNKLPDQEKSLEYIKTILEIQPENVFALNLKTDIEISMSKFAEAKKTNDLAFDSDSNSADVWKRKGQIALAQGDKEKAASYLEVSFSLKPDYDTALKLSDIFGKISDNSKKGLIYKIAALVLGDAGPDLIASVSYDIFLQLFTEDQIGKSIKNIRETLGIFKLNEEKIEALSQMNNGQIDTFIKDKLKKEVNDETRGMVKDFISLFTAWLFSFTENKNRCNFDKFDGNPENFMKMLQANGYNKDFSIKIIQFNSIMKCICEQDDYSYDLILTCAKEKSNQICGNNKKFSSKGICLTPDQKCQEDFGVNTHANSDGGCLCNDGYMLNETKDKCISLDGICKKAFGINSRAGDDNKCYCESGYTFSADGSTCISICPYNANYVDGECYCKLGYQKSGNECISYNDSCKKTYGLGSWGNAEYCYCSVGYEWNYDKTYCIHSY